MFFINIATFTSCACCCCYCCWCYFSWYNKLNNKLNEWVKQGREWGKTMKQQQQQSKINSNWNRKGCSQQKKVWSTLRLANDNLTIDEVVEQTSSLKDPTVDTSFLPDNKEWDRGIQIKWRRLQIKRQDTQNHIPNDIRYPDGSRYQVQGSLQEERLND